MSFDFLAPEEFFESLYDDRDFCEQLGKVILAAGILESSLRKYLRARGIAKVSSKLTLGQAVKILEENDLLTNNGQMHFNDIKRKRNYLAHNLYALFSEELEETVLPRTDLTAGDVDMFWEKAHNEARDYRHFSRIVMEADPTAEKLL
jgi:hypothetical protein